MLQNIEKRVLMLTILILQENIQKIYIPNQANQLNMLHN